MMDFKIPEGLVKVLQQPAGLDSPDDETVLADFGEEEGQRIFLAGDGLSEADVDELELYPTELANLLKSAIETSQAPRPESEGDWEGVSLLVVTSEALVTDVTGWVCRKCSFLVGGSAPSPPSECPGCNMGTEET